MVKRPNNKYRKPDKRNPNGKYERECPWCHEAFRCDNPRTVFCTLAHRQAYNFAKYYVEHRESIIRRVMNHRRIKNAEAGQPARPKKPVVDIDQMSPAELMEYIRKNPHLVRGAK